MTILLGFFFLLLNFGISWWNAYAVGRSWIETEQIGGMPRFMAWCGAIMSAAGFTWVYTAILSLVLEAFGKLSPDGAMALLNLGYLVIILPVLGSGLAIWLESVRRAWRERSFGNIGVAGWNTFAQVYNTYEAVSTIPSAFKGVFGFFNSNKKNAASILVLLAALVAIFGGILTTYAIVISTAKAEAKSLKVSHA